MLEAVYISAAAVALIQNKAESAIPGECCGLLIGRADKAAKVDQVVPAENQASDPHRFLIDPQLQFDWMKKLRGTERGIIGHYHSHPNGEPKPSARDEEMANEDGLVWLIVAVIEGAAMDPRAFVCQAGLGFTEVPLRIQP